MEQELRIPRAPTLTLPQIELPYLKMMKASRNVMGRIAALSKKGYQQIYI